MAAYKAFREPDIITDPLQDTDFGDFRARQLRYAIYWAFFENNAYRSVHRWSEIYKTEYGLYRYIRNIYNPAYRLAEFWKTHLMGGPLDANAGDGGTLPIATDNETLRPAIADVWRWSNWAINKDIFALQGTVFGDIGLKIVDDLARGKVYLDIVHPGAIQDVVRDQFGHVKGYALVEKRDDPRGGSIEVEYMETAERDGNDVVFKTYLNGTPYAWNEKESEWAEPYGFVPMVIVQHNNVGLEWGWSEFHPSREKIHEVDDLASKLHDQVRKMVDAPWFLTGIQKPGSTPTTTHTSLTGQQAIDRPQPGREEIPTIYAGAGGNAKPLVADLDIGAVTNEIKEVITELERDFPELKIDFLRASGELSGRALRIAQSPTEDKVLQRRANYDDALVRAQQMAVAIGGYRGYFPFGLDSYEADALDHSIGERPVFADDPLDRVEEDRTFWEAARAATQAGMPLEAYLLDQGWSEERMARLLDNAEYQARIQMMTSAAERERAMAGAGEGV